MSQHAFDIPQKQTDISKEEMLKTLIQAMKSLGPISFEELAALTCDEMHEEREAQLQSKDVTLATPVLRGYNKVK